MIQTALIGLGRWGSRVAEALSLVSDFQGYVNRSGPSEREAVRFEKLALEEMLARKDIRAVWLATPIDTHADIAHKVLAAGKHVMVEKPLAGTAEEAERLVKMAEDAGLLLATGYVFLFDPAYEKLKEALGKNPPKNVVMRWHKYGTFEETIERNLLTHHAALAMDLFGGPDDVRPLLREGVETECDRLTTEFLYPGFEAVSAIDRVSTAPLHTITAETADGYVWQWTSGLLKKKQGDGAWEVQYRSAEMPLTREAAAFAEAVEYGAPLKTQGAFGLRVLELQEKIR